MLQNQIISAVDQVVSTAFKPDGTTTFNRRNIVFQQDETCLDEEVPY